MDVRCGRCGTEYEFDDALISERGTTVKCTNCGFQFRVFPEVGAAIPERWLVRTQAGRELMYTSLRDLQRGIAKGHVGPHDLLSRGNHPPRALTSIPELEPFLRDQQAAVRNPQTLHGVAPAANRAVGGNAPASSVPEVLRQTAPLGTTQPVSVQSLNSTVKLNEDAAPSAPSTHPPAPATQTTSAPSAHPPAPAGQGLPSRGLYATLESASAPTSESAFAATELAAGASVNPAAPMAPLPAPASKPAVPSESPPTIPRDISGGLGELPHYAEPAAPIAAQPRYEAAPGHFQAHERDSSQATLPERSVSEPPRGRAALDLEAARMMLQHDEQTDSHYASAPPPRHARSRWLVFVVVLAAGGLLAATVGRRYLEQFTTKASASAEKADSRVEDLLSEGQRLMNTADLEGAREAFAKASALAENAPSVLTAQAELDVVAADLEWLRLRLLDPDDKVQVTRTHNELGKRAGRAQQAVSKAKQAAPTAPVTQRLLVHQKRLMGDVAGARALVGPLSKNASLPDNAYALAALDMAENKPAWASVVHRLRIAAPKDTELSLARAALVYALARWGQGAEAKAELDKLLRLAQGHPLANDLTEFVRRFADPAEQTADAPAAPATVDTSTLPELDTSDARATSETAGDFRQKLKLAHNASQNGDLDKAERLFREVLSKHPENTEALSGLAEIASRRNDPNSAARLYAQVLEKNPSYLPAQMASADQKWAAGDRSGALELYRRILDQAGQGSPYGARAARRIAQAEAEGSKPAPAPEPGEAEAPAPTPPESPSTPDSDETPHIDTTDLPEFNQ